MLYARPDGSFGKRIGQKVDWPPVRERIRQLVAEKMSASQIAAAVSLEFRMRFSRAAVIGQIHRHGLGVLFRRPADSNRTISVRKPKPWKPKPQIVTAAIIIATQDDDQNIPLEQRKSLLDLEPCMCRFPIGDVGK